ncbi:hypothetical protein Hanom_Chr07g00622061 [Helianthus anomalus]
MKEPHDIESLLKNSKNKRLMKICSQSLWSKSTLWKIRRWWRQLLVRKLPIHHSPCHSQPPTQVNLNVTMHKPYTRIISPKPDRDPPAGRDTNGVPFNWINKVEVGRVSSGVEVSSALPHHVKVEAVEVERVVFSPEYGGALHYKFHGGVVR